MGGRVGVFPKGEEVVIGGAGFRCVTWLSVRAPQAEMGERRERAVPYHAGMVEIFLKIRFRVHSLTLA